MLGRRLLLLVAVLLATGAIAAALTPRELRPTDRKTTATTPTTPTLTAPESTGGTGAGAREVTRTVDAVGRPTTASGLLALPRNGEHRLRTVSFTHGTELFKGDAPSVAKDVWG